MEQCKNDGGRFAKMPQMTIQHAHECALFLKQLRRTGNVVLSAEALGIPFQRFHHRRRRFPDFAAEWAAALAFAEAALAKKGVTDLPKGKDVKTSGGEYTVVSGLNRRLQVRRAPAGRITAAGERKFLATLATTANVNLACETIGVSDGAIYLRRNKSQAFAGAMDRALEQGYLALEFALFEAAEQGLSADGVAVAEWVDDVDGATPLERVTFDQALRLLWLHRRTVKEGRPRHAHNARWPTREETNAALMKGLAAAQRRMAREEERGETKKGRAEE